MPRSSTLILSIMLAWAVCAGAGTTAQKSFDVLALPAAFPGTQKAADSAVVSDVRRRLPPSMSVVSHDRFVIAARETAETGRRIVGYEAQIRRRHFPTLEARRMLVILGDDASTLQRLAKALYPANVASGIPSTGFYHAKDRLILTTTADGDAALLRALMRALVLDDNPDAPDWFVEAMATLYESRDESADRLAPALDGRMALIAPDEDLDYDVFAGICDCAALTAEQHALIRLLLVYLDERDRLAALSRAVREQGRYTTLLQALEAMDLDREAWRTFAERRVRAWWKARGETS